MKFLKFLMTVSKFTIYKYIIILVKINKVYHLKYSNILYKIMLILKAINFINIQLNF